jgi:hypothetical protein
MSVHFLQFFMEWYLLTFSDHKKALEYAWGIMVSGLHSSHSAQLESNPLLGSRHQTCVHGKPSQYARAPSHVLKQ